jgi:hypothetical protein
MFKKKTRLYHQAKKTNKWTNYKHFQKECKRQVRKAEWNYINDTIMEGLQNNNSKPFWMYVNSRKQDNIGVSPLKSNGQLLKNDSKGKADILITPKWVMGFTSKLQGRKILTCCKFLQFKLNLYLL